MTKVPAPRGEHTDIHTVGKSWCFQMSTVLFPILHNPKAIEKLRQSKGNEAH